ncbi:DUF1904 domain-containing protein [Alkaliphilus serpentinus]|uniref:DUF1904 domain-containing protein n=1 Tax=Alkaliphilus serpentinus TaxID=1482731 RepID=A0A833HPA0_9FIRM|nr:DUF1904 domain-containing protein [Alkaliphilus serpentinus]KAB3530463.1 DUF1904 domain-containing protein [Alkaliphilus serpentinus]
MPQIKVRGISPEKLCKIDQNLIDELVEIVQCPRDYFQLEYIQSLAIRDGNIEEAYPFVEVAWFDRGLEVQDQVAKTITKYMRHLSEESVEVAFILFDKRSYYEDGERF